MQGKQLLIMKGDNKTVAAGLVGGDYPLWVGATTPTDAPYKVSIAAVSYTHLIHVSLLRQVLSII